MILQVLQGDLSSLSKLVNLQRLEIGTLEGITGDIEELGALDDLEFLSLSGKDITGIAGSFAKLGNLEDLTCVCENVTGEISELAVQRTCVAWAYMEQR